MPTDEILLVGAGGHGAVVFDALLEGGIAREQIWVSDDNAPIGERFLDGTVVSIPALQSKVAGHHFHVAVGTSLSRQALTEALIKMGGVPLTIHHPAARVSRFAEIGPGTFVGALSIVGPRAKLGRGVIVNHGAIVDHDSTVGDFCHIAPNATIGGGVAIETQGLVGAGAVILPGIRVGAGATIGAGAVVLRSISAGGVYVGVPARPMSRS